MSPVTQIGDQIKGLTFAQGVVEGGGEMSLKSLREGFAKLPPVGQRAAAEALKTSTDPLIAQLGAALAQVSPDIAEKPAAPAPARPAYTAPVSTGSSEGSRVGRSG